MLAEIIVLENHVKWNKIIRLLKTSVYHMLPTYISNYFINFIEQFFFEKHDIFNLVTDLN